MALDPQIVRRDKASKHLRQPGEIHQGIVTSVKDDGRVFVKIPGLGITSGPITPVNSSPSNRLSVGDTVICSFNNIYNSSLVVFGTATQAVDDYSITRYATTAERDSQITSPQEGRVIYILDTDELQIYNGSSWITVIDTVQANNVTSISGTANQIIASASVGSVTLSTPQNIDTSASPTFANLTVSGNIAYHVAITSSSSTSYTLLLSDDGKLVEMTSSSSNTIYIPTDASVAFPVGTQITVLRAGTGPTAIAASASATTTVNATPGLNLRAQWSSAVLVKRAANSWVVLGDLAA